MKYALTFLGVGNAQSIELGSSSAVFERDNKSEMLIDCGPDVPARFSQRYGGLPQSLFITHVHLDHIGGMERLFTQTYFAPSQQPLIKLYVPAAIVPLLQERIANYPEVAAEGGANYWDAFQLIPVSDRFWCNGLQYRVFPTRHHRYGTSFGLALEGCFVFTGDTRPIPEVLVEFALDKTVIAHDADLLGNPSHSGIEDLRREYSDEIQKRLLIYHYANITHAKAIQAAGFHIVSAGQSITLSPPTFTPQMDK